MPLVKASQKKTQKSAMPQHSLTAKSSESQKTSPLQSLKYVLRPPPTEPMYIPLRDGLVLHKDIELWVSEEVQSEGQLLSHMTTGSPNHDDAQGRTGLVEGFSESIPQKRAAKWYWYGWPSVCSGLAVGIGILLAFYLHKYK